MSEVYAGLDVSDKATHLCVVDGGGKVLWREVCATDPQALAVEALLDGEAERLTRKAVDMALAGDTTALRLCLERIAPPRKDAPVAFALPQIVGPQDVPKALGAVLDAVAAGDLTPSEAQAVAGLLEGYRRAVETADIEVRLAAIEQQSGSVR